MSPPVCSKWEAETAFGVTGKNLTVVTLKLTGFAQALLKQKCKNEDYD